MAHIWAKTIDLSSLNSAQQMQVEQTLNWLEKYFPDFNEMIHEIALGKKNGKLKKIKVIQADETQFKHDSDTLEISFKASRYLGIDSKIYEDSLNETLIHELEHAAQKTRPNYNEMKKVIYRSPDYVNQLDDRVTKYLRNKGIEYTSQYRNFAWDPSSVSASALDASILQDPKYKKLSQEWVSARKAYRESIYPWEDKAMDRTSILSKMLGKQPASHYNYLSIKMADITPESGTLLIYKDSPEEIQKHGHKTWPTSSITLLPPIIHGEQGVMKSSIKQMNHEWNNRWNADTKNITSEEWQAIEKVKGILLSSEILETISTTQKKEVDKVIDNLKQDFNKTKDKDALSETSKTPLTEKGLGDLATKLSQKGWKL